MLLATPFVLLALVGVAVYLPPVQRLLKDRAVSFLSGKIGTPVGIERIRLAYPLGIAVDGLYLPEVGGDTLIHLGHLSARLSPSGLLHKRIAIGTLRITDVRAMVRQEADGSFNFGHIIRAFGSPDTATADTSDGSAPWSFSVDRARLERFHVDLGLRPSGMDLTLRLGALEVDGLSPSVELLKAGAVAIRDTELLLRTTPGPAAPDIYPLPAQPYEGPTIALDRLELEGVRFSMAQRGRADSLWLEVPGARIDIRTIDLARQHYAVEEVELHGPSLGMLSTSEVARDSASGSDPPWLGQDDGFRYWMRDMRVVADQVRITGGSLLMHQDSLSAVKGRVDPAHLDVRGIDLDAAGILASNDSMTLALEELAFAVASHRFTTALHLAATPAALRVSEGSVRLDGARMDFTAAAMPGSLDAAYRSTGTVPLRADIRSSLRPSDVAGVLADLGLHHPVLHALNEALDVEALFVGTLQHADTARMHVTGEHGTILHASAQADHFSRLPQASFMLNVEEVRWGPTFNTLARTFLPRGTPVPAGLSGHLHASGDGRSLLASLHLRSDLGRIQGELEASGIGEDLPRDAQVALDLAGIRLDRLLGDTSMGPADMRITGEAHDLDQPARRSGHLSIIPSRLRFQGQDLSSLRINASAHGDSLHALTTVAAEHLALRLLAHAHWPANDSLAAHVDLELARVHLQRMGWTDHELDIAGHLQGSATVASDGTGRYDLDGDGLHLSNSERSFTFQRFDTHVHLSGDTTSLVVRSDGLDLDYHTNVPIDSLAPRTRDKLRSYFQPAGAFIAAPGKRTTLAVALPNSAWLTGLVVPDLRTIELERLQGSYDSDPDILQLDIDLPVLEHAGIRISGTRMELNAKGNELTADLGIERVERDSLWIDRIGITARSAIDALATELRIGDPSAPHYRVPLEWHRSPDDVGVHVAEGLLLNGEPWTAAAGNMLHFGRDHLRAEGFHLEGAGQAITLDTEHAGVRAKVDELRIATLAGFISTGDPVPFATGTLDGDAFFPEARDRGPEADMDLKELRIMDHPVGDLSLGVNSESASVQRLDLGLNNQGNQLKAEVRVDRSGMAPDIRAEADIGLGDISFLQPFVNDLVGDLGGGIDGHLRLNMRDGRTTLDGDLAFEQVKALVKPLGGLYRLDDERLGFDQRGIHLQDLTLRDSLDHRFVLDGHILTPDLNKFTFDLSLRTDRFQLADAGKGASDLFYGKVMAGMDLSISGTDKAPRMTGRIAVLDSTDLSVILPGSKVELVEHEGVVVFTSTDDSLLTASRSDAEVLRDSLRGRLPDLELDLRVRVDPGARFAVVLDPVTADQATFRGTGDLRLQYDRHEDLRLTGPFVVEEGGYTLEFYGLVKKRFDLVKGSSVTWSGDPVRAAMDIKARYISNSAPYPLVANQAPGMTEDQRNRLQARMPFEVVIGIDGEIQHPEITFGLDLERSYRNSYPQVATELERLGRTGHEDERNQQVFGLLVLNSFIQDEGSGGAPSSSLARSAARSSVNGILTDQMNRLTGRFVKGVDIQLGVNTYDQFSGNNVYQRTSVDYKVSKSFINERLSFEVGGSVGVNEQEERVSNVSNTRAAQYAILYDLTKDGRFRLRGFHENAFDLYDGEITDSGIALMFTKEFEENDKARTAMREAARKAREEEELRKRAEEDRMRDRHDSLDIAPDTIRTGPPHGP